jgi:hypothetical protein
MYDKKIITREDGTQYVMCIRVGKDVVEFTEDQLRKQKAIEEFGTSA